MRTFWKVTRYARAARFWLFVLLATAAFFGCNEARAACTNTSGFNWTCEYQDEAYAKASEVTPGAVGELGWGCNSFRGGIGAPPHNITGYWQGYSVSVRCGNPAYEGLNFSTIQWAQQCPAGQVWNAETNTCNEDCTQRPGRDWNPGIAGIPNGSTTCDNGCMGSIFNNVGESGYFITYVSGDKCDVPFPNACTPAQRAAGWRNSNITNVCLPPTQNCPDGTARDPLTGECGNEACPGGMALNPQGQCEPQQDNCPAGQSRAPDGSCLNNDNNCPAGQVKGPDGTCKPDSNDDGEPDDDAPDSFSGGESCDVPPSCSGDVIMCGQARIQWRIDCNTRKDTKVNGGACNAIPLCVGKNCDALEYAQLLQHWRAACALERLAENGLGGGTNDGPPESWDSTVDAAAVVDRTAGEGDPGDAFTDGSENNGGTGGDPGGTGELDTSGLGWGSTCPQLPVVTVYSTTIDFNSIIGGKMCSWFQLGGQIVLLLAALLSLRILSGSTSV